MTVAYDDSIRMSEESEAPKLDIELDFRGEIFASETNHQHHQHQHQHQHRNEGSATGSNSNSPSTSSSHRHVEQLSDETLKQIIKRIEQQAFANPNDPKTTSLWARILQLDPRNGNAHVQLGLRLLTNPTSTIQLRGTELLERAYQTKYVDIPIPMPSPQGIMLAMVIGRFRWERREYDVAVQFLEMASQTGDLCVAIQMATMLHPFPNSTHQADQMLHKFMTTAQAFLWKHPHPILDELKLSTSVMGAERDPFIHCVLSIFHLSFYHRADVARAAQLHAQIATRVWPSLNYTAKALRHRQSNYYFYPSSYPPPPTTIPKKPSDPSSAMMVPKKPCTKHPGRKIKLGIASGFLTRHSSVVADFAGVLQRLDRTKFEITYIIFKERTHVTDDFVYKHKEDNILPLDKLPTDIRKGAWTTRYHPLIEKLNLDILLYLDLTMSAQAHRTAMARLAPVQATTHGHPITSGISSVDYYISWGAAELDTAQDHYVEQLILLPNTSMHQYYDRRSNFVQSKIDGGNYRVLCDRSTFDTIPASGNWYTCMQKPHKFMPEMDALICNVLKGDPDGRVILHEPSTPLLTESFRHRLTVAGCDMSRVHFLPVQPHHRLLALYSVSTVVLDSYPAGGCTTTREVLELGKVVITLPARLLGGRWSYAYYKMLGDEEVLTRVVATSMDDYVEKAIRLGQSRNLREDTEKRIFNALPNLFHRNESVIAWEEVLLRISPVRLPLANGTCPV